MSHAAVSTSPALIERKQADGLTYFRITGADRDSVQREVENLIDVGSFGQAEFTLPIFENGRFVARGTAKVSA
jgi:hypothetical protein